MPDELRLSKSAIDLFLSCAYAWYLGHVLRLKAAPTIQMAAGRAVHAGIEAHWKGITEGNGPHGELEKAWVEAIVQVPFDAILGVNVEDERLAAHKLLDTYIAKVAPTFTPTVIEGRFAIRVNGVLVTGAIDAADDESVHDTKSTSTPSKVDPARHGVEMAIYAHGYEALTGRKPKRLVLDVIARNGRTKQVEVTPDDAGMAEVITIVAGRIRAGEFDPSGARTGQCHRCPYAAQCKFANLA